MSDLKKQADAALNREGVQRYRAKQLREYGRRQRTTVPMTDEEWVVVKESIEQVLGKVRSQYTVVDIKV